MTTETHEQPGLLRLVLLCSMRYVRDGLASAVANNTRIEVIASLAPSTRWQPIVEEEKPDVVLVSAHQSDARRLVTDICRSSGSSRVVAHGQCDDDHQEVLAWVMAGAHGFLPQTARDAEITSVVECIARGEVWYATSVAYVVVPGFARIGRATVAMDVSRLLTRREQEVAGLIGQNTNKEIANRLGVEVETIKSHVHNILAKFGVQHRRDAFGLYTTPDADSSSKLLSKTHG